MVHVYNLANRLLYETALLVYDTLLVLSDEKEHIWKKVNLGTVLYFFTRYPGSLSLLMLVLLKFLNNPLKVCFILHVNNLADICLMQ